MDRSTLLNSYDKAQLLQVRIAVISNQMYGIGIIGIIFVKNIAAL